MRFETASISRVGQRDQNEDYFDLLQVGETSCWSVADGLGGHLGGEIASRRAVEAALASFQEDPRVDPAAVTQHVARAHEAIRTEQQRSPRLGDMRSTLVVLVGGPDAAVWGHVGDARLYRLRAGRVVGRTQDHSVAQALVNAGDIAASRLPTHEDRHRLLRTLGQEDAPEAVVAPAAEPLAPGDWFLLCTDGFWEALSDVAIEVDAAAAADAGGWLDRLERRVLSRATAHGDNYTALAVVTRGGGPDTPSTGGLG